MTQTISYAISKNTVGYPTIIRSITIVLNGFHCVVTVGRLSEDKITRISKAASEGLVLIMHCDFNNRCMDRQGLPVYKLPKLHGLLCRYIDLARKQYSVEQQESSFYGSLGESSKQAWDELHTRLKDLGEPVKTIIYAKAAIFNAKEMLAAILLRSIYYMLKASGLQLLRTFLSDPDCNKKHSYRQPVVHKETHTSLVTYAPRPHKQLSEIKQSAKACPKISYIIGVYNKEKYVSACLKSILNQALQQIEIICIDDCSQDSSLEIISAIACKDKRLRIMSNVSNLGRGATRNIGLENATGEYVMFVDADDIITYNSGFLLHERASKTHSDIIQGGILNYFASRSPRFRACNTPPDRSSITLHEEPHLWIPWWFTSAIFERGFLHKNKIAFPDLDDGEDPVFFAKALAESKSISTISEIVYCYRRHGGQSRNNRAFYQHLQLVKSIFESHCPDAWHMGYAHYVGLFDLPLRASREGLTIDNQIVRHSHRNLGIPIYVKGIAIQP